MTRWSLFLQTLSLLHHFLGLYSWNPGTGTIGELWLSLAVNQPALQNHIYTFQVEVTGEQWNWSDCAPPPERQLCGTIGFWKNWNKHETYPEEDIETWLTLIDNNSDWLGSITVNAMKAVLKKNKPMSANFLRHYLATRLDVEAGRLSLAAKHGISAFDPGNYLGLAMPSSTTLAQIVDAIESKFGTMDGEPPSSATPTGRGPDDALHRRRAGGHLTRTGRGPDTKRWRIRDNEEHRRCDKQLLR